MPECPTTGWPARRRGFTLLEITVVIVILGVLASIAVPRFTGMGKRRFDQKIEQIADMLTVYAQRQQMQQKPVGIRFDSERRWLELVILEAGDPEAGIIAQWYQDAYVNPIRFPEEMQIVEVLADGDPFNLIDWPLSTHHNEQRPTISITIQDDDGNEGTVNLATHAIVPTIAGGEIEPLYEREDLDAAGRSREEW